MICPCCGWSAREVRYRDQDDEAYTCDNGVCRMCGLVFTVHILGCLEEVHNQEEETEP